MQIVNESNYSYEELLASLTKIQGISVKKIRGLLVLMVLFSFGSILLYGFDKIKIYWVYPFVFCTILLLAVLVLYTRNLKKNNSNLTQGINYKYTFKDDEFDVEANTAGNISTTTIKYSAVFNHQVLDNDLLVIYVNNSLCYLVKFNLLSLDDQKAVIEKLPKKSKNKKTSLNK